MVNNIYAGKAVKILDITKHTNMERSFTLDAHIHGMPGQFVIVSLSHAGEIPISISGFSSTAIEITVRNIGKVTSKLFQLKVGDELHLRGPYGKSFPLEAFESRHLLIIAGGTGLAAVKPLLEYSLDNDEYKPKKLNLLVGFKSPKHLLFKKELDHWQKKGQVLVTVDTTEGETEAWAGGIGFVVDFVKHIGGIGSETKVVLVGPPLMITNTVRELVRNNVREENIWTSFERHMKCGVGKCGHCRIRDKYVCLDGPVFNYVEAKSLID
jgi:anaerobic sulfite reductase subunit B